jgi:hypothetical protein
MTETELQRVIQYVTARLSYGLPMTSEIIRTGFTELLELAKTSTVKLDRDDILAYVCAYTVKKTGHPETQVREVLDAGGHWLDQACEEIGPQENKAVN